MSRSHSSGRSPLLDFGVVDVERGPLASFSASPSHESSPSGTRGNGRSALTGQQGFYACVSFLKWDVHLLTESGLSASMLFYELE